MSTTGLTKTTMAERVRDLIAGAQKHPSTGTLTIDGTAYTQATLVQALQTVSDAMAAGDTAKAAWKEALQKQAAVLKTMVPMLSAYRAWVRSTYGNAPATLADFGLAPKKARAPLTTEAKAAAVAKRSATRVARHTMGSKQKTAVKGDVTGVIVQPVTASGASSASATKPAPTGASGVQTATPVAPAASGSTQPVAPATASSGAPSKPSS